MNLKKVLILFFILSSMFVYGCVNPKCIPQIIERQTYYPINYSCPKWNCFEEVINTLEYTKDFSHKLNLTLNS